MKPISSGECVARARNFPAGSLREAVKSPMGKTVCGQHSGSASFSRQHSIAEVSSIAAGSKPTVASNGISVRMGHLKLEFRFVLGTE
jgi:hypothetical protein